MNRYLLLFVKIVITFFALWYLLSNSKISSETISNIFSLNYLPLFVFSSCAFLISQLIISTRIFMLLKIAGIQITIKDSLMLTFIGNFFNMVVPGTIGGDVVKGYYLAKREKEKRGIGSSIVVVDRLIGLLALIAIGGISALYMVNTAGDKIHFYHYNIRSVTVLVGLILLSFVIFLVIANNSKVRELVKNWASRGFQGGFIYQVIEAFGAVTKKKRYLLIALIISIVAQFFSLLGLLFFADIIKHDIKIIVSMLAVSSLVLLVGIVPITPGNLGWIEMVASFSWSVIGSDKGAEIFLYWRIVTIICSLPGGIIFLMHKNTFNKF